MSEPSYKGYTLAEATKELELWKEARRAAATGQSYTMGSRSLTRYHLSEINAQIADFTEIVNALESRSGSSPIKVRARMRRW